MVIESTDIKEFNLTNIKLEIDKSTKTKKNEVDLNSTYDIDSVRCILFCQIYERLFLYVIVDGAGSFQYYEY